MSQDPTIASPEPPPHPPVEDTDAPLSPMVKLLVAGLILVVVAGAIWFLTVSGGGGEAKAAARTLIDTMLSGNVEAVRALCTSDVDFENVQREMKRMQDWGTLEDAPLTALKVSDSRYDVSGNLTFSNVRKLFDATLVRREDGSYRVSAVTYH